MSEEEIKCLNNCGFANVTQLLLAYVSLQQENSQLKERIEKAIEFIEKNKLNSNKISEMLCGSEIITLLEILKGDKE